MLGLVRHMAEVERNWFRPVLGGEEMATIFAPDMDWEAAFGDVATADGYRPGLDQVVAFVNRQA